MSSTFGKHLKLSIFGQSHGPAIGMTMDGIPAGLPVDMEILQQFLNRRAPGQSEYATTRKEADRPQFLSGIVDGFTCGAPIAAVIPNTNTRSQDYSSLKDVPRPGHADYTAQVKYQGFQDTSGGGHFSGRLTAPLCIAGGLCLQWLEKRHVHIRARIDSIYNVTDPTVLDNTCPDLSLISEKFPVCDPDVEKRMRQAIADAHANGDSVGGTIICYITGLPAGLGDPMFDGMESRIAQIIYGIPAVKGLEFGNGFGCTSIYGSQNNDAFTIKDGTIQTVTNHAGGILGGITNAMPLIFRVAIKPTPSIQQKQQSISISQMNLQQLSINGRHDPCIVPRAVPVIEAAAAIAVFDAWLSNSREESV